MNPANDDTQQQESPVYRVSEPDRHGQGRCNGPYSGLGNAFIQLSAPLSLMGLFFFSALSRQLNFDESLSLYIGWLLANEIEAYPLIYTPVTLALGLLADGVEDPALVFLVARIGIVLMTLMLLLWLAWNRFREMTGVSLFLLLVFTNSPFITHAMEFRYHWAFLAGPMAGFAFLLLGSRGFARLGTGLVVGWLLTNHIHGIYFAGMVYLTAIADIFTGNGKERRTGIIFLHLGMFLVLFGWLGITYLDRGSLEILFGDLLLFRNMATDTTRVWPWTALSETVSRDKVWWGAVLILSGSHLARFGIGGLKQSRKTWITLAFIAGPILLILVHPHAWPYHVIYLIPFLASLAASELLLLIRQHSAKTVLQIVFVLVLFQGLLGGRWFVPTYWNTVGTGWETQVATLRKLRSMVKPGDTVLDPSGLAYFLPPSNPEWYTDTLLKDRIRKGQWMTDLDKRIPDKTTWVLLTYRVGWIPKPALKKIDLNYSHLGGAIAVRKDDPRVKESFLKQLPYKRLHNYW